MVNESELPKRDKPILKPVKKPLASTRTPQLIYLLVLLTTLLSAYYGYRILQWKSDVGGWWNLALGKRPPQLTFDERRPRQSTPRRGADSSETVEDRINALADALGLPSRDLASAIAVAVKQHVPPASLSSVAAHQTGGAVEAMVNGAEESEEGAGAPKAKESAPAGGMMGTFVDPAKAGFDVDELARVTVTAAADTILTCTVAALKVP